MSDPFLASLLQVQAQLAEIIADCEELGLVDGADPQLDNARHALVTHADRLVRQWRQHKERDQSLLFHEVAEVLFGAVQDGSVRASLCEAAESEGLAVGNLDHSTLDRMVRQAVMGILASQGENEGLNLTLGGLEDLVPNDPQEIRDSGGPVNYAANEVGALVGRSARTIYNRAENAKDSTLLALRRLQQLQGLLTDASKPHDGGEAA